MFIIIKIIVTLVNTVIICLVIKHEKYQLSWLNYAGKDQHVGTHIPAQTQSYITVLACINIEQAITVYSLTRRSYS